MELATELAALFRRDLTRLIQQVEAFSDDRLLWECSAGMTNSAGNLALHLVGNLNEYVGRQLGGVPYQRQRDLEFSLRGISARQLIERIHPLVELVPGVIGRLSQSSLDAVFPEAVIGRTWTTRQFVLHLHAHFNYHLGQIDVVRRLLTHGSALELAGL